MKTITVVLVDDNEKYRLALEKFLTKNGIEIAGSFTHALFIEQTQLKVIPDIAIISFDKTGFLIERTIEFIRAYYSQVKILVNSIFDDRESIDKIILTAVQGMIFKIHKDPGEHILQAIDALHEGRNFFVEKK